MIRFPNTANTISYTSPAERSHMIQHYKRDDSESARTSVKRFATTLLHMHLDMHRVTRVEHLGVGLSGFADRSKRSIMNAFTHVVG